MTEVLILTGDDLKGLAEPTDYVQAVEAGYRDRAAGAPARPRTTLTRRAPWGALTGYTAILPGLGVAGGYLYTAGFHAADAWFTLPLHDAETGRLLAILDGAALNPLKTGAVAALGIDQLARDDASVLALIGTGRQAWGQLRCAAAVRELDEVRVFSPTREHREAFAKHAADRLGLPVAAAGTSGEAAADADIVITATRSREPVVPDAAIAPGAHVTAMGQYHPRRREVEGATVARAVYVPDLRERALQDSGELLLAIEEGLVDEEHIHAELADVVAGNAPGRTEDAQVTLFDSGGTGIETVAAAKMLYERALEAGVGTTVAWASANTAMEGLRR